MISNCLQLSWLIIFRLLAVVCLAWLAYLIKDIILVVFLAIVIAAAAGVPVAWLKKRLKIPRLLGAVIIYLALIGLLAFVVYSFFPALSYEARGLAQDLPAYLQKIGLWWESRLGQFTIIGLENLSQRLQQVPASLWAMSSSFFGGAWAFLVVLVLSFYLTVQVKGARRLVLYFVPNKHLSYADDLIDRIEKKLSRWLIGLVVLAMVVGTLTFIGLSILQIKFALFLAIIAGLLEFLPYLGPIMATVPAAIIAFSQEPIKALIVIGMYILIQWLENYLLVPQIMRKTVGLNSVVIIIVVLIGAKLAGLLGLILAVPVAAVLAEIIKDMKAANN